jgi:hypothetical protein
LTVAYEVRIVGLAPILRTVRDPALVARPLREELDQLSLLAQARVREGAPKDTGALRRSFLREVRPLGARVYSQLVYAPVMELGRRPGARMPPPEALRGWARRHGFGTSRSALFVLARAIARRGIKGRFYMRAAAEAVQQAMPTALARIAARISGRWRTP